MLQYSYLAVAVIVILAIGIAAVVVIRKRRSIGLEGMTYADPHDVDALADPQRGKPAADATPVPAEIVAASTAARLPVPEPPPAPVASAGADPALTSEQELEQLLTAWRAEKQTLFPDGGSGLPSPEPNGAQTAAAAAAATAVAVAAPADEPPRATEPATEPAPEPAAASGLQIAPEPVFAASVAPVAAAAAVAAAAEPATTVPAVAYAAPLDTQSISVPISEAASYGAAFGALAATVAYATPVDTETASVPVSEAAYYGAAFGAAAATAQHVQQVQQVQQAPSGNGSAATASAVLADPLGAVILDMAEGKGRLTGQELKRLEVFRPERIELAAETVQLPPSLEGDGEALMRLAQIKLYAATLELRSKWASQMGLTPRDDLPDAPYTARDFKLKMARDIMALPKGDRLEVIGFLLGGVINSSGNTPELKRAIIDTLEHLHSAALVNVLLDCIDDPDPIVQEYALAAADRLLEE
jgi:hypothetical protein